MWNTVWSGRVRSPRWKTAWISIPNIFSSGRTIPTTSSPDGTWKIVRQLEKENPKVHLLLRKNKEGRGAAGIDGFKHAVKMGAKFIVEMDADGSHNPKYIKEFREQIEKYDVIIGSRFVNGGSDTDRGLFRRWLSKFAERYIRFWLDVDTKDASSGYRMFRTEILKNIVDKLSAKDYFITPETLYYVTKSGAKIKEIPIQFVDRKVGKSKVTFRIMLDSLIKPISLRIKNKYGAINRKNTI